MHKSKCIKLYTLNMYHLLYVKYISIKLQKQTKRLIDGKQTKRQQPQTLLKARHWNCYNEAPASPLLSPYSLLCDARNVFPTLHLCSGSTLWTFIRIWLLSFPTVTYHQSFCVPLVIPTRTQMCPCYLSF